MKFLEEAIIAIIVSLRVLIFPLGIFRLLGGLVSGIWLAHLGEWGPIILGLGIIIFSCFGIRFALMPGMLFIFPAMAFSENGKKIIGAFFGLLSILYTMILLTGWCLYILKTFTLLANHGSLIPLLIWSYGAALAPWVFLSLKDQYSSGSEWTTLTTFLAEISYVIAMIMFYTGASFSSITITFGSIMLVNALIQTLIASVSDKSRFRL